MLECVLNVSEGRSPEVLAALTSAAGAELLDIHTDPHHHRSVLTLVGEDAPRRVAAAAVELIDLSAHRGAHPRLGAVDVVPFVPLGAADPASALAARNRFSTWLAGHHAVPCFHYGPERTLPEIRRRAFRDLAPDVGPSMPHPTAGASAVGARGVLVAYNVWLGDADLATTKAVAAAVRGEGIRSLGLDVGGRMQVSMNLIDPGRIGPGAAHDRVARSALRLGAHVTGAELVGLMPAAVLHAEAPHRWPELDLDEDRTIEARLVALGLSGG